MGLANNELQKPGGKVVIEPVRVIKERMRSGLHPSFPVPAGAVLCYDSEFWQWVVGRPGNVECDGWLKGSFLVPRRDARILVSRVPGFGAPTAVMTLEELAAFGVRRFVNLGAAGGLQQDMSVGDIVVCERAIRDEGTSLHYLPEAKYSGACPDLTERLCEVIGRKSIPYRKGTSWTIDAPYRETVEKVNRHCSDGVATVEMEASALFAVGAYRGVSVSSVFAISDILSAGAWNQGYHSEEKLEALKDIYDAALESIAEA
jgi:uridine phosphorylase